MQQKQRKKEGKKGEKIGINFIFDTMSKNIFFFKLKKN